VGRSYQLFRTAIPSEKTLQLYKRHLFHFYDYAQMTTEEIVSKYRKVKESMKLQQFPLQLEIQCDVSLTFQH